MYAINFIAKYSPLLQGAPLPLRHAEPPPHDVLLLYVTVQMKSDNMAHYHNYTTPVLLTENVKPPNPVKMESHKFIKCPRKSNDLNPQNLIELGFWISSVLIHQLLDNGLDGYLLPLPDGLLGYALFLCDQHPSDLGDVEGLDPVPGDGGQVLDGLGVVVPRRVVLDHGHHGDQGQHHQPDVNLRSQAPLVISGKTVLEIFR